MNYLITDHLGSVVADTDASGLLLEETRYMPFGSARSDVGTVTSTDKSFTGQKVLPDTGLLDYNARFYSSELGRFTQPDTIVPGVGNPQAWNRYAYTLNNPIKYTDPSGHYQCDSIVDGKCISEMSNPPKASHWFKVNKELSRSTSPVKLPSNAGVPDGTPTYNGLGKSYDIVMLESELVVDVNNIKTFSDLENESYDPWLNEQLAQSSSPVTIGNGLTVINDYLYIFSPHPKEDVNVRAALYITVRPDSLTINSFDIFNHSGLLMQTHSIQVSGISFEVDPTKKEITNQQSFVQPFPGGEIFDRKNRVPINLTLPRTSIFQVNVYTQSGGGLPKYPVFQFIYPPEYGN